MTRFVMSVWLAIAAGSQIAPAQDEWLKGFEGTWVVDNARGSDADIVLTINLTGKDATNANSSSKTPATFRTRIDNRKIVTEIWDGKPDGPPQRIETRYLESADVMVTDLSRTPGGPVFNRGVLRRKPSGRLAQPG